MDDEPTIIINGQQLNTAQAMTIRVALNVFAIDLQDGLGNDDHGKKMTAAYQSRLTEIFRIIGP